MNVEQAKALREPFPAKMIGKLPRKTKEGRTIQLDYVGHAATTDRLLQVDPEWTWEPLGLDEHGNPAIVSGIGEANEPIGLWIKLTVAGVTRPGFGSGKTAKEAISDAIRNAAMRFGVALDLWAKEDLGHSNGSGAAGRGSGRENPSEQVSAGSSAAPDVPSAESPPTAASAEDSHLEPADPATRAHIAALVKEAAKLRGVTQQKVKDALEEDGYGPLMSAAKADELVGKLEGWNSQMREKVAS